MFSLIVTFSDGHTCKLDENYGRQFEADRAASNYIRDFSDPCGLGVSVSFVTVSREPHRIRRYKRED